jgi:uncharacterized membrane protein YeaQ/YmgE (transglycosylase-associated protein family)
MDLQGQSHDPPAVDLSRHRNGQRGHSCIVVVAWTTSLSTRRNTAAQSRRTIMGIIAWIILGAIAGFVANLIAGGKEGVLGTILLGIVGAVVGGFIAGSVLGIADITGFNMSSILVAIFGAVIVLVVWHALSGRRGVANRV